MGLLYYIQGIMYIPGHVIVILYSGYNGVGAEKVLDESMEALRHEAER